MAVTIDNQGARLYFVGDTYAIKDQIKSIGGHYDGDRKAWWIGSAKADQAAQLVASLASNGDQNNAVPSKKVHDDSKIVAKATYKGRSYYVLWMGRCKNGIEKAHLTVLNGSIDFWADLALCEITKHYQPREYRGRTEYATLGSIRRFIEKIKQDESKGGKSPLKYPRTGCACGSRDGIIQESDCASCRYDAE
jgi:hypothetical protein